MHYTRHERDGQKTSLAFIDKGSQVEVHDWRNQESVLAALKVGAEKWDAVSVQGNAQYLETIVKLAAAHHIKITNPELQERIQQERARLEANRPAREVPQVLTEGQVQAQAHGKRRAHAIGTGSLVA